MITLTARIELLKSGTGNGENGTISGVSLSPSILSGNNASAEIGQLVGSKKTVKRPFVFGKSKLGSGDKYYGQLDYFMGGQLSDNNGNFAKTYTITVNGTNINAITLAFDDLNGTYPKSIIIDDDTVNPYVDDDPLWTIVLDSKDSHKFTISNWNKPNSPLIISGIYIDLDIKIDRHNMVSLERSLFDRADINLPSYGIISNTGSIAFNDIDGEIKDYAEQQILKSGLNVTISLNNTLTKASQTVAVLKTSDWDYDNYNRAVTVQLKDDLEEWQEVESFRMTLKDEMTAYELFEYLKSKTPSKFEFEPLNTETTTILQNTTIQYPYLNFDNLWRQWEKLCELCLLHIYKDNENKVVCTYNNGD